MKTTISIGVTTELYVRLDGIARGMGLDVPRVVASMVSASLELYEEMVMEEAKKRERLASMQRSLFDGR